MTTSAGEPEMHGGVIAGRPLIAWAWDRCCAARDIPMTFVVGTDDDPGDIRTSTGHPVAVLVDVDTARRPWIDLLNADRRLRPVVLSPPVPSPTLRRLLALGCRSLITTDDHLHALGEAMDALLRDQPFTSPSGLRLLFETCASPANEPARGPAPSLSHREQEVLRAMVDGSTIKATARGLDIAVKTVEGHRRSIFTKLGVANQTEAITRALRDPGVLGRGTSPPPYS